MTVQLYTEPIVHEFRQKSHLEVQDIKDPESRDNARAGVEKMEEINRCIKQAFSRLAARCVRWLRGSYSDVSDNAPGLPESFFFEFQLSERRALNTSEGLVDAMNTFMVEYALSKYYSTVNQGELSNKHSLLAIDAGNQIDQILYTKQPPRV